MVKQTSNLTPFGWLAGVALIALVGAITYFNLISQPRLISHAPYAGPIPSGESGLKDRQALVNISSKTSTELSTSLNPSRLLHRTGRNSIKRNQHRSSRRKRLPETTQAALEFTQLSRSLLQLAKIYKLPETYTYRLLEELQIGSLSSSEYDQRLQMLAQVISETDNGEFRRAADELLNRVPGLLTSANMQLQPASERTQRREADYFAYSLNLSLEQKEEFINLTSLAQNRYQQLISEQAGGQDITGVRAQAFKTVRKLFEEELRSILTEQQFKHYLIASTESADAVERVARGG